MKRSLAFLALLLAALGLVGTLEYSDAHIRQGPSPYFRSLHATNHARGKTWACQDALGRPRTHSVYSERRTASLAYARWVERLWERRARVYCRWVRQLSDPVRAIIATWGRHAGIGLAIARCESGLNPRAVSSGSRYWGLFQFGAYARNRYGFAWDALTQARAAYRMYVTEGRQPWPICGYR